MKYYVDKLIKDRNGKLLKELNINDIIYRWNTYNKNYQTHDFNLLTYDILNNSSYNKEIKKVSSKNNYYIYSGTPETIIGELRYPIFATKLLRVARRYARNIMASSLATNKKGTEPKLLRFIITPNIKILDMRKKSEQHKFEKYYRDYSISGFMVKTKTGLPDWTEGIGLAEYIHKHRMNYDIILLDEGQFYDNGKLKYDDEYSYMILNNKVKMDKVINLKNNYTYR